MLVRVVAPHFVAGVEFDRRGRCVNWAPILRWMRGNTCAYLLECCRQKGWTVERIDGKRAGRA